MEKGSSALPSFPKVPLAVVTLSLTLYLLFFWFGFAIFGQHIDTLSGLWVVLTAWLFGVRGGLLAGLFNFALHIALFSAVGEEARAHTWETPGMYVRLILGVGVGWAGDMFRLTRSQARKLEQEIAEREASQRELRALSAELEERVEQRTAQLEAANKELEAFSYSVSHDLRAPLRAINSFSEILLEDYLPQLDSEAQKYFGSIRNNAQRMGQLIDDLLTFSRLSRQHLSTQSVDMNSLVHQILQELQSDMENRQIDLRVDELPQCYGDRSLLKQVLVNLLTNAVKFTRHRDVAQIHIGSEQQGDELVYFVKDNGAGFDMRHINKLFDVFQRLHLPEEFEGTGVGLAIVQRVITRHGGRVWAEGSVDHGASFYFSLPSQQKG